MANAFDFEINADENATKVLAEIEARIKGLQPVLNSTREGLRFGGSETLENTGALSNKLRDMSRSAQDNVQNIGDMIPPLKNFGELFTKYSGMASKMGLLGGIGGAIGYGMSKGYQTLRDMGKEAYNLDVLSKNTAMSIEDSSSLIGAMVQIGTEADRAKDSVQNLFNTLNAAEWGENGSARAELDKLGVKIHTTKDGSADVIPTLLELEEAFKNKNIPSETENRLIVKLGLTPEILALLREGKIQERLDKSVKNGQSRTAEENQKLTDFNTEANEVGARIDGMWNRTKIDAATWFLDKGKEAEKTPAWQTIKDIRMRESDTADNFYHGNKEKDIVKRAIRDKEFISQLTFMEEFRLLREKPDENLQKKLNDRYGESWEKQKKAHEAKAIAKQIPVAQKIEAPIYPNPYQTHGKSGTALLESMSDHFATLEKKYGLDPGLLHGVAMTESAGNPNAMGKPTKSGQAKGMFQFMPGTAAEWGLKGSDVFDPYKSAEAAAKMLGSLLKTHNGNLNKALASYNWGIGNVQKEGMGNMPTETRNYIPRVRKNMESGAAIAEKNINRQEQPFPSLYGQKKESEYEEVIAANIAKAVREAIGDKPFLVEIALVDNKTGERQRFQEKTTGKITTSMKYPS